MIKRIRRIISVVFIPIICIFLISTVRYHFALNSEQNKNFSFYKNKNENEYDVLFFGTSHMVRGILPMELWKEYEITSFNLANLGQLKGVDYWLLKDALKRNHPKLVVLDVYALSSQKKINEGMDGFVHESFDFMPLSLTKINAVNDLYSGGERLDFIFPLAYRHNNWDLNYPVWENKNVFLQKGSRIGMSDDDGDVSSVYAEYKPAGNLPACEEETVSKEYIRKMIKLCQDNDTEVLLLNMPYVRSPEDERWDNSARVLAEGYGINYLDLNSEENINYSTDTYDGVHLNSSGARKVTNKLGEYIIENYKISNEDTERYDRWQSEYPQYVQYKVEKLKQQKKLNSYLLLLADNDFDAVIELGNLYFLNDPQSINLLKNLGVNTDELNENARFIIIKNGGEYAEVVYSCEDIVDGVNTLIGELSMKFSDNTSEREYEVLLNGNMLYKYQEENNNVNRFVVISSENRSLLDVCSMLYQEIGTEIIR